MNTMTLPDGPSLPRFVQGGLALAAPLRSLDHDHTAAAQTPDPAGDHVHGVR